MHLKENFYLQTWFIAILFGLWFIYGIPLVIGNILLIIQTYKRRKLLKSYGDYDEVNKKISDLDGEFAYKNNKFAGRLSC